MSEPFLGEIRLFAFNFAPRNWATCSGQLLAISQNTALFSLLGTTYGGNGQTTFALPDLRGRLPVHVGTGPGLSPRTLGEVGGANTVTVLTSQLPAHSHPAYATTAAATTGMPGTGVLPGAVSNQTMYVTDPSGGRDFALAPQAGGIAGGNQPHENNMPSLVMNYSIVLFGIYPSRN